ncbi:hypothetical protein [Orlajensenia leifsoniae]|uniref:hypothetical protein n=1 Tax=Orlajensenia leifsoniae TaxID=2561933 RepID=UPI0014315273|nr:hypothetical protein [Leifsonia flava]
MDETDDEMGGQEEWVRQVLTKLAVAKRGKSPPERRSGMEAWQGCRSAIGC